MAIQKKKNNSLPFVIIGVVLVVGLIAAWAMFSNSKTPGTNNQSANGNTKKTPVSTANAPAGATPPNMAGSPTALVTIEEFADFQCPTCATTHPVMNEIKSVYGSRIKFIFRNYPLAIPAHDKSYEAAVATEAAGIQGKFWDMQNLLFNNQQAWTANPNYKQVWNEYAQKLGIDVDKFQSDMAGLGAKSRVDEDIKRGRGLNVNSTPTILVNGVSVESKNFTVNSLRQIIDGELQKTTAAGQAPATNAAAPAASNSNTSK